ncbi:MAG: hypothetical protein J3K34DRAFT_51508 [Monoraphidium minutum]|nr:MAG: hypothetical protein J3K34DRAFT_51508 [Monoraphidium minutum]
MRRTDRRTKMPGPRARAARGGVGASISAIGMTLLTGAKGVVGQVTDLVEGELSGGGGDAKGAAAAALRRGGPGAALRGAAAPGAKYSHFEAELAAMQRDSATYCDEPPDLDYAAWRDAFGLADNEGRIGALLEGNVLVSELQARLVPLLVRREEFWCRYFFRLQKLQQREEQRQRLAARAMSHVAGDDEELGWDDEPAPHAGGPEVDGGAGAAAAAPAPAAGAAAAAAVGAGASVAGAAPAAAEEEPAAAADAAAADAAPAAAAAGPAPVADEAGAEGADAVEGTSEAQQAAAAEGPAAAAAEAAPAAPPPAEPQPQQQPAAARPPPPSVLSIDSGFSTPVRLGSDGGESSAAAHADSASDGSLGFSAGGPRGSGWAVVGAPRPKGSPVIEEPEAPRRWRTGPRPRRRGRRPRRRRVRVRRRTSRGRMIGNRVVTLWEVPRRPAPLRPLLIVGR